MRLNALAVTAGFAVMFASAYPAVNGEAVIIAPADRTANKKAGLLNGSEHIHYVI